MPFHDRITHSLLKQVTDVQNLAKIVRACQIVPLLVYTAVIYFFAKLEKKDCPCAENESKTFIKRAVYCLIVVSLLVVVLGPLRVLRFVYSWLGPISTAVIRLALLGFVVYLMVRMYNYAQHLRRTDCRCATAGLLDETLQYYSVAVLVTLFVALLTTLFFNLIHLHGIHVSAFETIDEK